MSIILNLQNVSKSTTVPTKCLFKTWIEKTLKPSKKQYELGVRIVGIKEITRLNKKYRKKNKSTNILSFSFSPPLNIKTNSLGDLVICAPIVKLEAKLQHKTLFSHWAHLTVHGVLHLLGYNHHNEKAAQKMEKLEIKILKSLSIPNPYK